MRIDVDAADPDRWRTEEAQPLRRCLVGHVHQPQLRLDPELAAEPLDRGERRFVIRTTVEVEDLHQRHPAHQRFPVVRRDRGWPLRRRRSRDVNTTWTSTIAAAALPPVQAATARLTPAAASSARPMQ